MACLLLHFTPLRFVDYEEADYGELPIALVDGLVGADNVTQFQTFSREGSMLVWAVPTALVFGWLGPSLFSLKLAAILASGLWAVAWFWVARLSFPRAPAALVAAAFAMPLPLIQIASVSATSLMTHLGSSLWHGLSLLALCLGLTSRGPAAGRSAMAASGLACGLGLYCGYSLAPLVPGLVWMVVRSRRRDLQASWLAGLVPGLALFLIFLTPQPLSDLEREPAPGYSLDLVGRLLLYGGGIYVGMDAGSAQPAYSRLGVLYPLLLAAVLWAGASRRASPEPAGGAAPLSRRVVQGLALSSGGLLAVLWVTRFELAVTAFDGLRYLVPLAAPLTVLLAGAASRLPAAAAAVALGAFVMANLGAYVSLLHPLRPARFLHLVRGYRGTFFLHVRFAQPLLDLPLPAARRTHYAIWMGTADALRGDHDLPRTASPARFAEPRVMAEYWRGVGLAQTTRPACVGRGACIPEGTPPELVRYVWQGVGFASRTRNALDPSLVPAERRDDYAWGAGRASVYSWSSRPRGGGRAFAAGAAAGWTRDLALPGRGARLLERVKARALRLYAVPLLRHHYRI